MQLQRLVLENYNCHEYLEVDFTPGLNGIVGSNGSGKSSILDALRFAVTGDSIGEGVKKNNVRWGAHTAKVTLKFQHGNDQYVIERVLGKKNGQTLRAPDLTMTKTDEIDVYLSNLFGTTLDSLSSNVFVPQGGIDSILFSTNTNRLKEFQATVGLNRISASESVLGDEIGQYRLTVGLDEQIASLEADRASIHAQATELREAVNAISVEASQLAYASEVMDRARKQQAAVTERQVLIAARNELSEEALRYESEVHAADTSLIALETEYQLAKEAADAAAKTKVAYASAVEAKEKADKERVVLSQVRDKLAALPHTTAEELARLEGDELEKAKVALSEVSALVSGKAAIPPSPEVLQLKKERQDAIEAFNSDCQRLLSIKAVASAELSQVRTQLRSLETLGTGPCPTCHTELTAEHLQSHLYCLSQQESEQNAVLQSAEEALTSLRSAHFQNLSAMESRITELESAAIQRFAGVKAKLEKKVSALTDTVRQMRYTLQQRQLLQQQEQASIKFLSGVNDAPVSEEDYKAAEDALRTFTALTGTMTTFKSRAQTTKSLLDTARQKLSKAQARLQELEEFTVDLVPADLLERAIADTARRERLMADLAEKQANLGALDGKRDYFASVIARLVLQRSQERAQSEWVACCRAVREAFHVKKLPTLLMQEYAKILNKRIEFYTSAWRAPFRLHMDESLSFVATFPDGKSFAAARLSGGQRIVASISFRLAMADTFAAKAGLLVLDEPSNYLDQDNIIHLQNVLLHLRSSSYAGGRQIILVTHEQSLSGFFDNSVSLG